MPYHVARRVGDALNSRRLALRGSRILILGVAYKADVDDIRESPSLDVIEILEREGAHVEYCDPYVPSFVLRGRRYSSKKLGARTLRSADSVVVATAHRAFDYELIARHSKTIVDTRNAIRRRRAPGLFRL